MRILITGASGFIGSHLTAALLAADELAGPDGEPRPITDIIGIDLVPPPATRPADPRLTSVVGDAGDAALLADVMRRGVDSIFALGATLTSDAEAHFAHGLEVNLHGFLRLLEACRSQAAAPRLVYTSSIAAFGGALPERVGDGLQLRPQTSYGTAKAINELLISDHSRRGFIDGRALRLPIVLVRPGSAGTSPVSVSDRVAGIVREPLRGHDVVCPLRADTVIPIASARAVAEALIGLHELPASAFGSTRSMNLPSLSVTVAELAAAAQNLALRRPWAAPIGRIHWQADPALQAIVDAWPRRLVSERASALGLAGDVSVDVIVDHFIADFLTAPT